MIKSNAIKKNPIVHITSLAETPESAGMLRYFAQICLQTFTSFPQIYDVTHT